VVGAFPPVWKEVDSGKDLPTRHEGKPVVAACEGEEGSGRFSHELVKGEYRMVGQTVVVTITDKHWLLPWPVVEVRLWELLT
jgi:hypothetical protein